jgi:hypothetical protein
MEAMELAFGDHVVRLDGTVIQLFLRGIVLGAGAHDQIHVNHAGFRGETGRNGDVKVYIGLRTHPYTGGPDDRTDLYDPDLANYSVPGILELTAPQWEKLQVLLAAAAARRTPPTT